MGTAAGSGRGRDVRALAPLAGVYRAALAVRERLWAAGITTRWALPQPVVSVGNLSLGGTSKTPLVIWLAERLRARGMRPGVALRGYAGAYEGACARVPANPGPGAARWFGDEACLIARRLQEVPVAVGRERALAALELVSAAGVNLVILDDGFQHRRLARDLDVVLLDARAPLGNGRLLPAGPLREPPSALQRARLVIFSRWDEGPAGRAAEADPCAALALAPGTRRARCRLRAAGLRGARGEPVDGARVAAEGCLAFCGVARPDSFRASLEASHVRPLRLVAFRDHHQFTPLELDGLVAQAALARAGWLVTTEKDAVRLDGWAPRGPRLAILRVDIEVEEEAVVLDAVAAACARRAA